MFDRRNRYRTTYVNRLDYWRVEYRPWFWPFWSCVDAAGDIDSARILAKDHAARAARANAVHFGRLPEKDGRTTLSEAGEG